MFKIYSFHKFFQRVILGRLCYNNGQFIWEHKTFFSVSWKPFIQWFVLFTWQSFFNHRCILLISYSFLDLLLVTLWYKSHNTKIEEIRLLKKTTLQLWIDIINSDVHALPISKVYRQNITRSSSLRNQKLSPIFILCKLSTRKTIALNEPEQTYIC